MSEPVPVTLRPEVVRWLNTVPRKCDPSPGAGVERNPCTEPGSLPRCQLCPLSPTYWRRVSP